MCPVDSMALANKKNLVDKSKLVSELHRINKEERTDIRLLNNAKQRFKNRYNKLDSFGGTEKSSNDDPSDVVMYETHTPGFCYRRNGECRSTQSSIKNTALGYNDIHGMVFSDDEVDIDKILCLLLLRAHSTETLSAPSKNEKPGKILQRDQSPLERLVERSKKKYVEDKMIKMLPIHVLTVNRGKSNDVIRDGRLAARLIINDKLNQLIKSVMMALDNSNSDKLKELIAKAHNNDYLKHLICHPDMQDFINSLNGFNVVSCCESFQMTPPFKCIPIEIKIKTATGYVESLVNQIRRNIFKLPINCCWEKGGNNFFQLYYNPLECPKRTETIDGNEKEIFSERLDETQKQSSSFGTTSNLLSRPQSSAGRSSITGRTESMESIDDENNKINEKRRKYKNPGNINKMNLDEVAAYITKKANNAIQKDLKNLQQIIFPIQQDQENIQEELSNFQFIPPKEEIKYGKKRKQYSLKQTTCPACCEKWKVPLPPPKSSVIKKNVLQKQDVAPSDSSHHLSMVLERELQFWNQYNTKSSRSIISASMKIAPKRFYRANVIEIIDLDELDLAKIRQQIRERETGKKLQQFLTH
ncbi:uncharacterized protein [Onthophagus taurus]|uniref:uncharacterized protein n=1 Tax=Onthophagus taurus TaxID=166361 RepID=UPI0039BE5451